jgi:hypothetical protein
MKLGFCYNQGNNCGIRWGDGRIFIFSGMVMDGRSSDSL